MTRYSVDQIETICFDTTEAPDVFFEESQNTSYRLSREQAERLPRGEKDIDGLRVELATLFAERLGSNYAKLTAECDIKQDTFQKVLRHKNGRRVTYRLLAKFCVGVGLSVEEADALFRKMDYPLNDRNRCDFILLCALENGSDIVEYDEDLKTYGYQGVLSKAD